MLTCVKQTQQRKVSLFMSLHDVKRSVNKKHLRAVMALRGLTQEDVGERLNPPVSRVMVSKYVNKCSPPHRLGQIADVLETDIDTIFPVIEDTP